MSFKQRLTLFTTLLVIVAVCVTAATLGWNAKKQLLATAESEGQLMALMLARSAGAAVEIPKQVEGVLDGQMVSQAVLTAHFVAVAEKAGLTPRQIVERLQQITAETEIDELWITDSAGRAYINTKEHDFVFSRNASAQPQASKFWPLLDGSQKVVVQKAQKREIDHLVYKYVGVTGVDKPRIVQVGYEVNLFRQLNEQIGLEYMVKALVSGGDVDAIWVVDPTMKTIAHGSVLASESGTGPDKDELVAMEEVFSTNRPMSFLTDAHLTVMSPVPGAKDQPIGVTLVRLPTAKIYHAVAQLRAIAIAVGLLVTIIGVGCSLLVGRRMVQPVVSLSDAASAVQNASFHPELLACVSSRQDELGQLSRTFVTMAAQVFARQEELDRQVKERTVELEAKNDELASAHKMLQDELEVARALQLAILPTEFPHHETYQIYARMVPAREMGGDFYDIFEIDDSRLGILVADVSGKGVPAAFFMAVARTELHTLAVQGGTPGTVLRQVNDKLCDENPLELFVTVFYAVLDLKTGTVVYANGGHNPPYLAEDRSVTALETTGGIALGIMPGVAYREREIVLQQGSSLYLFTDGVTEAFNKEQKEFGEQRLQNVLASCSGDSAEMQVTTVFESVEAFSAGAAQSDDITSLCLVYSPAGE